MNTPYLSLQVACSFAIAWVTACSNWQPEICANGLRCPAGSICTEIPNDGFVCSDACGNGQTDPGEQCDDGNRKDFDGCNATCILEQCGNGITEKYLGEVCDDTNTTSGDGCDSTCRSDETCGNDILDINETCEDGNPDPGDGCSHLCIIEECGNGIFDQGELCDCGAGSAISEDARCEGDQNSHDGGYCREDCRLHCGDGVLKPEEKCEPSRVGFCTTFGKEMGTIACTNECEAILDQCEDVEWVTMTTPNDLEGVFSDNSGGLYIFKQDGSLYRLTSRLWRLLVNGSQEREAPFIEMWTNGTEYVAVDGTDTVWSRNGSSWIPMQTSEVLGASTIVWGSGQTIFIGSKKNKDTLIWLRTSDSAGYAIWTRMNLPEKFTDTIFDIWGSSPNDVFAVGQSGAILHYNGNVDLKWETVEVGALSTLVGVWGAWDGNAELQVFVVGESGVILHRKGGMTAPWEEVVFPGARFSAVWGSAWDDVFAAGRDGALIHYDGVNWAPVHPQEAKEFENLDFESIVVRPNKAFLLDKDGNLHRLSH